MGPSLPKIVIFTLLLGVVAACSPKKEQAAPAKVRFVAYMGDPMNIVAGATMDGRLDRAVFEDEQKLRMTSYSEYKDIREYDPNASLTAGQEPEEEYDEDSSPFYVRKSSDGIGFSGWLGGQSVSWEFTKSKGRYGELVNVDDGEESYQAELLHFSQSKNKDVVSFLFRSQRNGRLTLSALYFQTSPEFLPPIKTNQPYNFSFGKGIKIPWASDEEIELNICGDAAKVQAKLIKRSWAIWEQAMAPHRKVNVKLARKYAPFSDLQQACIYFIDDLYTEPNPAYVSGGRALTINSEKTQTIIDADILMINKEYAKHNYHKSDSRLTEKILRTLVHEFGHFFGLDHVFDGRKSVMSYDPDRESKLYDYDIEAIRVLYGADEISR